MAFSDGDSFLVLEGDRYVPTSHSRGPWDPAACHGGPPAGAIAREVEALVPAASLARLTGSPGSPSQLITKQPMVVSMRKFDCVVCRSAKKKSRS